MFREAALITSFLAVSGVAQAQTIVTPPTEHHSGDVVVLKDGTVLHGTVGEMTPNQSLIITVDGQARKIEWKDLDRVEIDRAKAPPAQAASANTFVHIDGPPNAIVQALDARGTSGAWVDVCKAACDRELPSGGLYRIDAPGIRTSRPFRIDGPRAELRVKTASSAGFAGGLGLFIFGGVALVNGLGFFLVANENRAFITDGTYDAFMWAGGILTGVGVASMVAGGILLGSNLRTTVTGAATVRLPAWRDFPAQPSSSRFAAMTFPAISGSF